jgi:hypothetical protein
VLSGVAFTAVGVWFVAVWLSPARRWLPRHPWFGDRFWPVFGGVIALVGIVSIVV